MNKRIILFISLFYSYTVVAFSKKGHVLIEKRAYELLQDSDTGKEIFNCLNTIGLFKENSKSNHPDWDIGRQFLADRQVYHFMSDYKNVLKAMKEVDRPHKESKLLKLALGNCIEILYIFFREIIDNCEGADQAGRGIYVLMHIVADSYSREHTIRDETTGAIKTIKGWKVSKMWWHEDATEPDETANKTPTLAYLHTRKGNADYDVIDKSRSDDKHIILTPEAENAAVAIKELLIAIYESRKDTLKTDEIILGYLEHYFKPFNSDIRDHHFVFQDDSTNIQISYRQLYDTNTQITLKFDWYLDWTILAVSQYNLMNLNNNAQGFEIGKYCTPYSASAVGTFFRRTPIGASVSFTRHSMIADKEINPSFKDVFQVQVLANACFFLPLKDIMLEPHIGCGVMPLNLKMPRPAFVGGAEFSGYIGEKVIVGIGWEYDSSRLPSLNSFYAKLGYSWWQGRKIFKQKKEILKCN